MDKFISNKYNKIYFQIIYNAKSRTIDGYHEKHHIIPKSLGGTNDQSNIVSLTAREHLICHRILTKITVGKNRSKMFYALHRMIYSDSHDKRYIPSGIIFENIRKAIASNQSSSVSGSNNPFYGKTHSDEYKAILKLKNSGSGNPMYGKKRIKTKEEIFKISEKMKGHVFSDERNNKISSSMKEKAARGTNHFMSKNAKHYKIIHPNGAEEICLNLSQFIRTHNLTRSSVYSAAIHGQKVDRGCIIGFQFILMTQTI